MSNFFFKKLRGALSLLLLAFSLAGCGEQSSGSVGTVPSTGEVKGVVETNAASQAEQTGGVESKGFKKPEEALSAYLKGIETMSLPQMLGSFAVESYVKNIDFQANLDRTGGYTFDQVMKYPNSNPLLESMNIESRRNSITDEINNQYFVLGYTDFEQDPAFQIDMSYKIDAENTAEVFMEDFGRFLEGIQPESLKLLGFISPENLSEVYSKDANLKIMAKQAEVYGADKIESCVAVFELHGDKWLLCADTINYGGKWYILNLQGNIGQLLGIPPSFTGTMPIVDWDSQWESKLIEAR